MSTIDDLRHLDAGLNFSHPAPKIYTTRRDYITEEP